MPNRKCKQDKVLIQCITQWLIYTLEYTFLLSRVLKLQDLQSKLLEGQSLEFQNTQFPSSRRYFLKPIKKTFAFLFIVTNHAVHEKNEVTAKLLMVGYLNQLQVGFDNYVTNHRKILNYAWVNFPLAYTQVVHMTVYAYFFATLFR